MRSLRRGAREKGAIDPIAQSVAVARKY